MDATATYSEAAALPAFRLRAATAADQQTIKQMVNGAHLNPMGLKWQRFTMAVTDSDQVVGCIQLKPHGEALELASLVTAKGWRRKGIARQLIDHVKGKAERPLWLMCSSRLTKFYEQLGFEEVRMGQPMPGYFRWMLRLAYVFNRFGSMGETLAIMVWRGG